jgi:hypothetical protein
MAPFLAFGLAVALLALLAAGLALRKHRPSAKCSACGSPSQFGYSKHAESERNQIAQLCLKCLTTTLRDECRQYAGHALVIEPVADLPCYVFQPASKWADSKLAKDLTTFFSNMEGACRGCGSPARFLWTTANGLLPSNFSQVLSDGLSQTLLRWSNDKPYPMCSECCVRSIVTKIDTRGLTFLEVCSPRLEDGFVIPMAY